MDTFPTVQGKSMNQQGSDAIINDMMGSEMVLMIIGKEQADQITVHMNLLARYTPAICDLIKTTNSPIHLLMLPEVDPTIFKLFIQIVYSRDVPRLTANMTTIAQSFLIRRLARLYAFLEKYNSQFELRNKVMDRIQDGFALMDIFPPSDFITAIYENTVATSPLRLFAAGILVYRLRVEIGAEQLNHFGQFLAGNPVIMKDFLAVTKGYVPETDPRIRNCKAEPGCVECDGDEEKLENSKTGYWPCYFHIHRGYFSHGVLLNEEPEEGGELFIDYGCYLWDKTKVKVKNEEY